MAHPLNRSLIPKLSIICFKGLSIKMQYFMIKRDIQGWYFHISKIEILGARTFGIVFETLSGCFDD